MTDITTIPLNKLLAWDGNVRKTDSDKTIDELAASIAAHGLLQSLVVRTDKRGKYAVVAGRRRLLALQSLAEAGTVKSDMDIPCQILDGETDAAEISLAENVQREPMHPADEFEAFAALIDGGMPVADVAARFGVTETVVQKRLKLAKVSPKLIAAYRMGEMTLQHVMAFTVTDDHAAQELVWKELADWQTDDPDTIREALTENAVTAHDRRVQFVTLKAYEKAGGKVRRDLFSEGENGIFIEDVVLLESLVAKKLDRAANAVRKEGWKWIEIRATFDHDEWSEYGRRFPELTPLSPEQQAEMDSLVKESEALSEIEDRTDEQQARFVTIEDRLAELESRESAYSPETLGIAGAVVTLGHDGKAAVHCGYVKPEDVVADQSDEEAEAPEDSHPVAKDKHPASLVETLTSHRSAALSAAMLDRPDVALAATVHVMAWKVFYNRSSENTPLQVTAKPISLRRIAACPAIDRLDAARDSWEERVPETPSELFAWCLAQDDDTLRRLLAFCVAQTINAVRFKSDRPGNERLTHAHLLAEALNLDMAAWFTPTAANYFGSVSKAVIIDALRQVKGDVAPAWSCMKKPELAALAERQVAGTGWLPEPLRAPVAPELAEAAE